MSKLSRSCRCLAGVMACAALLAAIAMGPAIAVQPSNKWRLEVDGRARSDGKIELSLTPAGGEAVAIVVPIPAGTGENTAARVVRDELMIVFGEKIYGIEVDDGEDVLVKARRGTPDFELGVIRNTVDGLKLKLDRE